MIGDEASRIRKARYAGSWYSAEADVLERSVAESIDSVRQQSFGGKTGFERARFAVLPHAGHTFSSRGLAHFALHAPLELERVVVLAPSHYAHLPPDRLTMAHFDSYETPLGDLAGFDLLASTHPRRCEHPDALRLEHAVEMILPYIAFLQHERERNISVAAALVSQVGTPEAARLLASDIEQAIGTEALESGSAMIVASSDFTHYGQRFAHVPFGSRPVRHVADKVRQDDLEAAQELASGDLSAVIARHRSGGSSICGLAPAAVVSALAYSLGAIGLVADYYTSLDVLGYAEAEFVAYCTVLWR